MLVFDIGFNHGNFSRTILAHHPSANVIGVEGHPGYEGLFQQNPIAGVQYLNGVVSDMDSESVCLFICDSNPGINSINERWIEAIRHNHYFRQTKREIQVKSYTIDTLMKKYGVPNIIKLDIEGAELPAIRGMKTKSDIILFEWCEEFFDDTLKCVDILKSLGYTKFAVDHHTRGFKEYNPDLQYFDWDHVFSQCDVVGGRKETSGMIYAK